MPSVYYFFSRLKSPIFLGILHLEALILCYVSLSVLPCVLRDGAPTYSHCQKVSMLWIYYSDRRVVLDFDYIPVLIFQEFTLLFLVTN